MTGHKVFDDTIYYFDKIPTIVEPFTVFWIVAGALLIAVGGQHLAGPAGGPPPPGPVALRLRMIGTVRCDVGSGLHQYPRKVKVKTMMTTGHLSAHGLVKSYWKGQNEVPVLRGVDLEVERGEMVAVVGASGSGKSTLLHLLGLLDAPDSGEVRLEGERIDDRPDRQRDGMRNRTFGFIFQFYHLLPELTALENVLMPQLIGQGSGRTGGSAAGCGSEAEELLERVGLGHRLDPSAVRALRRRDAACGDRAGAGRPGRPCCWPTSRPATSTPATARRCSNCCAT